MNILHHVYFMVPGCVIAGKMNFILNIIVPVVPLLQEQSQQKAIHFISGQTMSQQTITRKNVADNWCGKHPNMKIPPGNNFNILFF